MNTNFGVGWRQVGCCFVLLMVIAFAASSYSLLAVPLGREFHPSRMVLMLAMTIMAGVSGLISPFLGSRMDRGSIRVLMLVGAICMAAGYAGMSFATSFTQVLICFGMLVAPANVLIGPVAATVLISRWFVTRRGAAIGMALSGIGISAVVFPPVVQGLLGHYQWREAFRLIALLLAVLGIPAALLVIERPALRGLFPDGADREPDVGADAAGRRTLSVGAILGDPAFWIAVTIFAVTLSGAKGMITNLAPMAIDQGIRATDAAYLISIFGASGFVAKFGFAIVADKLGPRLLMFLSLAGFAIGLACLAQAAPGYAVIAAGVALIGGSGGVMVAMQSFLIPQIFGRHSVGRAMGLMSTVMLVFLLATPPLFGRVYDVTGSYTAIFLAFIVLTGLLLLLVPCLRLTPRRVNPASEPEVEMRMMREMGQVVP